MRNLYGELFGFRREFDEMFNRILTGKPWTEWAELPAFQEGVQLYSCSGSLRGQRGQEVRLPRDTAGC